MLIKKGTRVYNVNYGIGTAITNETELIGAVVKFDTENENLFSAKDIRLMTPNSCLSLYLGFLSYLDEDYSQPKKLFGICYLYGNCPELWNIKNIVVKDFDKEKEIYMNKYNSNSKDVMDKVMKDKKKTESNSVKDFAKEKENKMENLYKYDPTLKDCKSNGCSCNNKVEMYMFINKDTKELLFGNKGEYLWDKSDALDVINELVGDGVNIEEYDIVKVTGKAERVEVKKTVKYSI